ncbi:MAG TPA: acyl carrier protein [Methylomusa anaerophila]|uniref:Acyl carrier protein n=1 Tax=Methylomusa anaerophila TaxID=1930071 RepID=A0A348AIA2_9FIRM|nr:acyl carrier protein [Methylomusa anaerophila]BBB90800.1 acyl carrier protein [Methylomusa anaerophila]HML90543.1 acyl carrier protein [Methylomusa anaerophila]
MLREEIFDRVKKVAQATLPDVDVDSIKLNAHLRDHLGLDSVDAMSLIIALEEEFKIAIPDARVRDLTTVEAAVNIIEEYIKEAC